MVKKIFKSLLIFSVVLSLTIPANAAVSVADGSAFVTKAEFSADLNNLSNRMAQLENSLDSKIDSLVSAYLTRNGIWNGSKQTLVTSQLSVTGSNLQTALSKKGSYYSIPKNATNTTGFIGNYNLVADINKTGMMVIIVSATGYAQATKYGAHNGTRNVGTGNIYVTFNVGSDVRYTSSIGRLDSSAYSSGSSGGDYLIYATTDLTTVAQFFVAKTEKLDWDIYSYFNSNGVPDINWGAQGTTTIKVLTADIY